MFNHADKHITIKCSNNTDTISIDRVKPVFIEKGDPSTNAPSDDASEGMCNQQQQHLQGNKQLPDGR